MNKLGAIILTVSFALVMGLAPNIVMAEPEAISHYFRLSTPATSTWSGDDSFLSSGGFQGYDTQWTNAGGVLVDYRRGSNGVIAGAGTQTVTRDVYEAAFNADYEVRLTSFEAIVYRGTTTTSCNDSMTYEIEIITYVDGLDPVSYVVYETTEATTDFATNLPWRLLTVSISDERDITSFEATIRWQCVQTSTTQMYVFLQSVEAFYEVEPVVTPEYLYPLLASDEWDDNFYNTAYFDTNAAAEDGNAVFYLSKRPGAYIHAIADGTIASVERIDDYFGCDLGNAGECAYVDYSTNALGVNIALTSGYWWGDDKNIWSVILATDTGLIRYVVASAPDFVTAGAVVKEGCIVGRTLQATWVQLTLSTEPVKKNPLEQGVGVITRFEGGFEGGFSDEYEIEILDYMIESPVQGSACNAEEQTRNCMGDVLLESESDWVKQGSVTWSDGGVLVGRNSNITSARPFNINETRLPQMSVSLRNTQGNDNPIRLQLGDTEQLVVISSSAFQTYEIPASSHAPDTGDYYTIGVYNDGMGAIEIEYICVSHSLEPDETTPIPPPPPHPDGCYFINPSFDEGAGWYVGAGVEALTGAKGFSHNGTIWQPVTLYPNGGDAQTYTITIRASLWHYASFSADETNSTDITIAYNWADAGYETIATHTVGAFVGAEFGVITYQNTFSVATDTSGNFVIKVTLGTPPTGLRGLQVRDVCLEAGDTTDGDPNEDFPGFDDPENPPGIPPDRPLPEYCAIDAVPQGDGVGGWISWLWSEFNSFFQCELMVLLNDIYSTILSFFRMVGWFFRWLMTVIQMMINWMVYQVFPWLAGYFVNLMGSQVGDVLYTSNPGDGGQYQSCQWYDLFCHAGNLFSTVGSVISGVGDFIGGLINGVIDVIEWLFGGIVDVVEWLWERLSELINGLINVIRGLFEGIWQVLGWLLNAIGSVVNFIVTIVSAIVTALVNFVRGILEWIGTALAVIGAIITGASTATPQTIPGIPTCATPEEAFTCLMWWALENTVFSGIGSAIIPLVTAIIAIGFAIWYLRRVRKVIMEAVIAS